MNKKKKPVEGAQSVFRGLDLLGRIASHHADGVDLATLVAESGLDRTTTYRLVSTLQHEQLVEREPLTRLYRLGVEAMQIGLTSMGRAPILDDCLPVMQTIARESRETVYLIVRNGDFAHCLHVEYGAFLIRTATQHVGRLRLLGLGAASQALLATLTDAEIEGIYRRHAAGYESHGVACAQLLKAVGQGRRDGHAMTQNLLTDGVLAVGVAFEIDHGGHAAMSVASTTARMPAQRRLQLVELVRSQVRDLGFAPVVPARR